MTYIIILKTNMNRRPIVNKIPTTITAVTEELRYNTQAIFGKKLRKIIIYGSYARGDYKDYSDLDIMVLADYDESEERDFQEAIYKISSHASLEHDITVSMYLNNESLFKSRMHISPYYRNVISEGVELYGT
jgi:predicted nucleotidyltransferase